MKQKDHYTRRLAHRYDKIITGSVWWTRIYMRQLWKIDEKQIVKYLFSKIPNDWQGKLLDVPIGTAVFTIDKYRQMPQAEVVGLDYSDNMLSIAKHRIQEFELPHVQLIQGDVAHLPFEDETFDGVLSMNGLHVFPNREQALKEMHRVLKKGGYFWAYFYIRGERNVSDWIVQNILDKKGIFTPPHYNKEQAIQKLNSLFEHIEEIETFHSILVVKCRK